VEVVNGVANGVDDGDGVLGKPSGKFKGGVVFCTRLEALKDSWGGRSLSRH